jgi:hypothetical protein
VGALKVADTWLPSLLKRADFKKGTDGETLLLITLIVRPDKKETLNSWLELPVTFTCTVWTFSVPATNDTNTESDFEVLVN